MFLTDGYVLQHVVGGAQSHGSPLMDALWLDVQDVLVAGGGHAARLLNDVSHGVAFVQQSQLLREKRSFGERDTAPVSKLTRTPHC